MILEEPVTETHMRRVIRCDVCCKAIRDDYDKRYMRAVTFTKWTPDGVRQEGRYHLCETCASSAQYDYEQRRKRMQEGVTPVEQEALLMDLYADSKKKRKRRRA